MPSRLADGTGSGKRDGPAKTGYRDTQQMAESVGSGMGIGEAVALLAFVALVVFLTMYKERRLADPNDPNFIYIGQMPGSHQIRPGPVAVRLYRQSGNEYRDLGMFQSTEEAVREIEKSFRRASIESLSILKNTPDRFEVIRLHHGHNGKAEGKKLGSAVMVPVDQPLAHSAPVMAVLPAKSASAEAMLNIPHQTNAGGALGHYGLREWWEETLTHDEKHAMLSAFAQPWSERGASNPLVEGSAYYSSETIVAFLSARAGWFNQSENRSMAFKLIAKAEEFVGEEANILTIHFLYHQKILSYYRWRDEISDALKKAMEGCHQQIEIGPLAAIAFRKDFSGEMLPSHTGFKQLAIIEEKRGNFAEVVRLCELAESQGWAGDWRHRAERAAKRQAKIVSVRPSS